MRNWLEPADLGKAGEIGPACMHESQETPAKLERVTLRKCERKHMQRTRNLSFAPGAIRFQRWEIPFHTALLLNEKLAADCLSCLLTS